MKLTSLKVATNNKRPCMMKTYLLVFINTSMHMHFACLCELNFEDDASQPVPVEFNMRGFINPRCACAARVTVTKLDFLQQVMERDSGSLSGWVLETLCDDFESVCLVRECRKLEESFGTRYVDLIIGGSAATAREMKEEIFQQDRQKLIDRCLEKAPVIAVVAGQVGWARLWDAALDFGGKTVRGMQMLTRVMSHHRRGSRPCPLCDDATLQSSVLEHILENHGGELFLELELDTNQLLTLWEQLHLGFVACLTNMYRAHLGFIDQTLNFEQYLVCVSVIYVCTQHLSFNVFIGATSDTDLGGG